MKMYRIKWMLSILVCSVCVMGCSQEYAKKQATISKISMGMQITDEGMFYIDGYTEVMKFYDFQIEEAIPLCDRPNCRHNSKECNAYLEQGAWSVMAYCEGHIYYIDVADVECPVYRCDKNGANRKELIKLNKNSDEYTCDVATSAFLVGNQLLIAVQYNPYKAILSGEINGDMEVYTSQILSISLKDGSIRVLKEFTKRPSDVNALNLADYIDGKLLYYDSNVGKMYVLDLVTLEEEELYDYNDADTYFVEFSDMLDMVYYIRYEEDMDRIYEYNLKTGEKKCLVEVAKTEKMFCMAKLDEELYYGHYDNDGVWEEGVFGKYNTKEGKQQNISKEEFWYMPHEGHMSENWYCMVYPPKYYFISKENFEKQNWDEVKVLNMY